MCALQLSETGDFSKYKMYAWVNLKDTAKLNDITENEIKAEVDNELWSKGLTKFEPDKPDLFVTLQTAIDPEQQFTTYSTGWGYGPSWYSGGWSGPGGSTTTIGQTSAIYTGQLTLDFYPAKHELGWPGVSIRKAKPDKQKKNWTKRWRSCCPPPEKKSQVAPKESRQIQPALFGPSKIRKKGA